MEGYRCSQAGARPASNAPFSRGYKDFLGYWQIACNCTKM